MKDWTKKLIAALAGLAALAIGTAPLAGQVGDEGANLSRALLDKNGSQTQKDVTRSIRVFWNEPQVSTLSRALVDKFNKDAVDAWTPGKLILEGATDNAYELTLAITDPTADRTITLPDATGAVVLSTLATNVADADNAVWFGTNSIIMEGATGNGFELIMTLTDPTADNTVTWQNDSGVPLLKTSSNGLASMLFQSANDLKYEGTNEDDYESMIRFVADPTFDVIWLLPVGDADSTSNGALFCSLLSTNGPNAANSLWGASNALVLEGASADAHETSISPVEPTGDNTVSVPNDTGTLAYTPTGGTTVAADELAIPVTHAYVAKTTGGDAEALTLENGQRGQMLTICLVTDGNGDGTLTPTTKSGFATIVFADAGDTVTLLFVDDTVGWVIVGSIGVAAPPVITQ